MLQFFLVSPNDSLPETISFKNGLFLGYFCSEGDRWSHETVAYLDPGLPPESLDVFLALRLLPTRPL